jgi:hypothetical protein
MPDPTRVECFDAYPRDLKNNDRSRFRGETPAPVRATAERTTNLGNGLTATTYVDSLSPHNPPQA